MASLYGSASCSGKPLPTVFGNVRDDSVGTHEHQRDEICTEGHSSEAGRSSACFVNLDSAAGINQAGGDSLIHTIYCSARTSTGSGFKRENEEERFS